MIGPASCQDPKVAIIGRTLAAHDVERSASLLCEFLSGHC